MVGTKRLLGTAAVTSFLSTSVYAVPHRLQVTSTEGPVAKRVSPYCLSIPLFGSILGASCITTHDSENHEDHGSGHHHHDHHHHHDDENHDDHDEDHDHSSTPSDTRPHAFYDGPVGIPNEFLATHHYDHSQSASDDAPLDDDGEPMDYQVASLSDVDGYGVLPGGVGSHAVGQGGAGRSSPSSSSSEVSHFGFESDAGSTLTPPTSVSEGSGSYDGSDSDLVYDEDRDDVMLDPSLIPNFGPPYLPPEWAVGTPEYSDSSRLSDIYDASSEGGEAETRPADSELEDYGTPPSHGGSGEPGAPKKPKVPPAPDILPIMLPGHRGHRGHHGATNETGTSSSESTTTSQITRTSVGSVAGGLPATLSTSQATAASWSTTKSQTTSLGSTARGSHTTLSAPLATPASSFANASHASINSLASSVSHNASFYRATHTPSLFSTTSLRQTTSFYYKAEDLVASKPTPVASKTVGPPTKQVATPTATYSPGKVDPSWSWGGWGKGHGEDADDSRIPPFIFPGPGPVRPDSVRLPAGSGMWAGDEH